MRIQQEKRHGSDRRQTNLASIIPRDIDRRWKKDQRSGAVDESMIYRSDEVESDDYWQRLFSIPSEDCK